MIILPHAKISPVTTHLAVGGMLAYGEKHYYDVMLNVASELSEYASADSILRIGGRSVFAFDAGFDDEEDVDLQLDKIEAALRLLKAQRDLGRSVVVTCAMGRNRSVVVVAEHLCRKGDVARDEIVEFMRVRRHGALSNHAFCKWLERKT